MMVQHQS